MCLRSLFFAEAWIFVWRNNDPTKSVSQDRFLFRVFVISYEEKQGTLLTELNNYGMEVTIQKSETLREVLCPTKQDSTLPEPYTILSSRKLSGIKKIGHCFLHEENDDG